MATVTPMPNGPYKVEDAEILDAEGTVVKPTATHFLCRCGQSSNKPFCDGTHAKVGFTTE